MMKEEHKFGVVFETVKSLLAGATAGVVSRTATSPLERVKCVKQVQVTATSGYTGVFASLAKMTREEGIRSLWKGNGTNIARIAPYSALQFYSFDNYKRVAADLGFAGPYVGLVCGAMAGMTSCIACYPLDLVRSYLTVQTATTTHYNGIISTMIAIQKREGIRGLYRGMVPTLFGITPYIALNFATFDALKHRYKPEPGSYLNLLLGGVAGGVAACVTYPTDIVKRRVQLQGYQGSDLSLPKYNGAIDCVRVMLREEGVRGMYKGLSACLSKVVPSMAIAFSTHEYLRKWFDFDKNSKPL